MIKAYTICYILYIINLGYYRKLNSDLSRQSVSAVLLSRFPPVNKVDNLCKIFYWVSIGLIF